MDVIVEAPFRAISAEAARKALALIETTPRVIDAGVTVGPGSERLGELIEAAKQAGKYEREGENP